MWQQVFEYTKKLLALKQQTDQHSADIKKLQQDVRDLTATVQDIVYEFQLMRQNEAHERANMALRLENALLRFELRPPPGSPPDQPQRLE